MRALVTGNCQASSLAIFLRKAMPQHEIRHLPFLATFFNEFSEEQIAEHHAWADIVFYHTKHDHPQDYPTKNPKVPMSVWYQGAPFIAQLPQTIWDHWKPHRDMFGLDETVVAMLDADLLYEQRWVEYYERMRWKEVDEGVPQELRMSDMMELGRTRQLQRTCNHPTSLVFREWALRVCKFLGEKPVEMFSPEECIAEPNLGELPCEDFACIGARRHLRLYWGGDPDANESCRQIIIAKLNEP